MPVLQIQNPNGSGMLRKQWGKAVIMQTSSAFRYPPLPVTCCPDATFPSKLPSQPCNCFTQGEGACTAQDPVWGAGMKHVFVTEAADPNDAGQLVATPITEYADMTSAIAAGIVGVADSLRECKTGCITVYRQGVIRFHLATPAKGGVNDWWALVVDAVTSTLHPFSATAGTGAADSIGRGYIAHTEAKSWVDVQFSF